jgi:dephospho-CoA kinase
MLLVAVTGGIGSGKSTLAGMLRDRGGVLVDADALAREVVEPGRPALAEIVAHFGPRVLTADATLDRAALAEIVFSDASALAILESITHPPIRALFEQRVAALPADAIVIHEVPLLAEKALGDQYHLVVGVTVTDEVRAARLAGRGMDQVAMARRLAHQVNDIDRARHCDLLIANDGGLGALADAADRLWSGRLVAFAANMEAGVPAARGAEVRLVPSQPDWHITAERLMARLRRVLGADVSITHVGSTAVPGLPAKEIIDLQVTVVDLEAVDPAPYRGAGYAMHPSIDSDTPRPSDPDPGAWRKRFFRSCDPGCAVNIHVRQAGSPGERFARLFPAWLTADPVAREEYATLKEGLAAQGMTMGEYADAKEPWLSAHEARMLAWAEGAGWR